MSEFHKNLTPKTPPSRVLPLIEKLIEAYKLWKEYHRFFPKETKYSLGEKIDRLLTECIESALTAMFLSQKEKRPFVHKATVKLDTASVFLRIAWEIKSLDSKKYAVLSVPLTEAGRQLGGWHNQLLKQNSAGNKLAEK